MCELSPSAAAFSTMLSAFIGSVLNGLFSGFGIAFFTGWISWLACIRIIAAGAYEFFIAVKAGTTFDVTVHDQYQTIDIGMNAYDGSENRAHTPGDEEARLVQTTYTGAGHGATDDPPAYSPPAYMPTALSPVTVTSGPQKQGATMHRLARGPLQPPVQTVTIFGWLAWIWSAIYTPISQSLWLAANMSTGSGILLIVRAMAMAVSALGLTFDYKQRYAASLGRKWGSWAFLTFNMWNSIACLLLGAESMVLLIFGATRLSNPPLPLLIAYPIFSIIWAVGSWSFLPPMDAARPGVNIVADVSMGAFAGIFVAGPAFAVWRSTVFDAETAHMMWGTSESGMNLGDFLSCEGASAVQKFAAVMP